MRIAQVAPLVESVPPRLYGGTERVVSFLTDELVALGHDVVLFAAGDSQTNARLVPGCAAGLRLQGDTDYAAPLSRMLDEVRDRADEFDIIHSHVDLFQHAIFKENKGKIVSTIHGGIDYDRSVFSTAADGESAFISVSYAQRKSLSYPSNWLDNVYHGLPAHICRFSPRGGKYLAFMGRISPEKRLDRAIEVAKRSRLPLKIAAKIDSVDRHYFHSEIESLLEHPLIEFIGEIDEDEKCIFLGDALALLFPIDWPEPFGLVQIEAMSAGTPVIAWRNGSVPEIVRHGSSGYIVDSLEEAVAATSCAAGLDRQVVRLDFESRFTAQRMGRSYVEAYRALLRTRTRRTHAFAEIR